MYSCELLASPLLSPICNNERFIAAANNSATASFFLNFFDSHAFTANCSASIILSSIHQCNTTLLTLPAPQAYSVCLSLDACYSKTVSFMYEDRTEGASVCKTRERKANQRLLWAKQLNTG